MRLGPDPSSFAQPDLVKIQHIDLDWNVNFGESQLAGTATIRFLILAKFIEEIVSKLCEERLRHDPTIRHILAAGCKRYPSRIGECKGKRL